MAGSPKKRAKREAAAKLLEQVEKQTAGAKVAPLLTVPAGQPQSAPLPVLHGEIMPPADAEPTRTAMKRAMRARAAEYAERAIAVLAKNLDSADPRVATAAANDLLAWGYGKPATEIEVGDTGQTIMIMKFGDSPA